MFSHQFTKRNNFCDFLFVFLGGEALQNRSTFKKNNLLLKEQIISFKGRFLLFQMYRNFANLFFKLSVSTFYKQISKFQQKIQSKKN